jgi:hypothetical protein
LDLDLDLCPKRRRLDDDGERVLVMSAVVVVVVATMRCDAGHETRLV